MPRISTGSADEAQCIFVRDALRSQRERLPALFRSLADDEWIAPSRCAQWSVHEVVRHLCDATLKGSELLQGQIPEGTDRFDPRTTPLDWLARSAGESPPETLESFEEASNELLDAVDRHVDAGSDDRVPFLYGPVPWSMSALHVFWDAWVHERDIVLPLERPHDSPPPESRAAAAYGVTIAGVSPMLQGAHLNEPVVLTGDGGGMFRLETKEGAVTTTIGEGSDAPNVEPLRGELVDVVDSLVGRGPELTEVLDGPAERVEQLGMLRALMLLPVS